MNLDELVQILAQTHQACQQYAVDEVYRYANQKRTIESPGEAIKDPKILKFLDIEEYANESDDNLETRILKQIKSFLLTLNKGFLFEAQEQRFSIKEEYFYIDLVSYNRLLRCYALILLKTKQKNPYCRRRSSGAARPASGP